MSGDIHWNSVEALWFNDNAANNSTTFTDQSKNNFALTQVFGNNATYTTSTAPTGMTSSVGFTTSSARALQHTNAESAWAFSGDYTVEYWLRYNGLSQQSAILDFRDNLSGKQPITYIQSSSNSRVFMNEADRISGALPSDLTWCHYALCRSGSSTRLFLDGSQTGSTYTDSTSFAAAPLTIGDNFAHINTLNGWMCSLRITKGVARYTSTFTPPTLPLETGLPPSGGPFPHYINDPLLGGLNAMRERVRRFISLPSGILTPRPGIILPRGC